MTIFKSVKRLGAVALAASVLLAGCAKDPNVAATVNGKEIPTEQYEREYKVQAQQAMAQYGDDILKQTGPQDSSKTMGELMRENTLENLIGLEIVKQDAEKNKINVTDEEVDAEVGKLKEMYGGDEAFNKVLASNKMSLDELKEYMHTNILMRKYQEKMLKDLEPKEDEIKAYYDKNKDKFKTVEASHILVENKDEADAIKKQLDGGADFASLAKEKSKDTQSAQNGGSLGAFGKGQMVKEFDDKVFSMKPGEISDPVKTQFGYHIIKLDKVNDDYESAKEAVKAEMIRERFQKHSEKLRKEADVKRNVDTSKEIPVEPIKTQSSEGKGQNSANDGAKTTDTQNAEATNQAAQGTEAKAEDRSGEQ